MILLPKGEKSALQTDKSTNGHYACIIYERMEWLKTD